MTEAQRCRRRPSQPKTQASHTANPVGAARDQPGPLELRGGVASGQEGKAQVCSSSHVRRRRYRAASLPRSVPACLLPCLLASRAFATCLKPHEQPSLPSAATSLPALPLLAASQAPGGTELAELLVFGSALTRSQRQDVERYLGAKYPGLGGGGLGGELG